MTRPYRKGNVGLEQLRRELVTPTGTRPVEDVPLASPEELDRVLPKPKPIARRRPARRPLTPEEERHVADLKRRIVRSPSEQEEWRRRKTYPTATLFRDRQGDKRCRCGESWPPCKVHLHRQHQEPYVRELRES